MKFFKILMLCVLLLSSIHAQPKQEDFAAINFRDLSIDEFIKLTSNILNKNILLQSKIPGKVEFISTKPVLKKDLPKILQSTLNTQGYTLVDRGSFLEIVRSRDVASYNLPLLKNVDEKEKNLQMITDIFEVKGVNVDIMASKIRHLSSPSAKVLTLKESNSLLITDFAENIETIKNVLNEVEKNQGIAIDFIKLENSDINQAYPVIRAVIKDAFDEKVDTEKVNVWANQSNDTIIVVGVAKNMKKAKKIIKEVDSKKDNLKVVTKTIQLKNTESKNILATVNQILIKFKGIDRPVLASDELTNSIVVVATEKDFNEIYQVIQELDKEQKQVFVKARVIEISDQLSKKIGLRYGLEGGEANSNGLYTFAMNMGGPSISLSSALSSLVSTDSLKSGLAFGASIDFLNQNGAANIVSEPSILCLNNLESKIYVGQTQSIITSATNKDNSTDLTRNTYSREDIGLTLKVKPRISSDNKVTLQIEAKIEDVIDGSGGSSGTPTTTKREVTTRAIVKNGESVIVGGLIRDKSTKNNSKVPLLSDIPLLGKAFNHDTNINDKLNIVIVLTPFIVPKSQDLSSLRLKLVELDMLQEKYSKTFKENILKQLKEEKKEEKKVNPYINKRHQEALRRLSGA